MEFFILVLVGLGIGFVASIVGSGGGFLMVPFLLLTTDMSPQFIAGTALLVDVVTSLSSALAYRRQHKIDWPLARVFIAFTIPGIFLGVYLNQRVTVELFTLVLGLILLIKSLFLFKNFALKAAKSLPLDKVSTRKSALLGFIVGAASPIVGIGGGVLRVPPMIMFLRMPPKIAAATSQLVTLSGSLLAAALFAGNSQVAYVLALPLGLGTLAGAQAGAYFSLRSDTRLVVGIMSVALFFVGLWMVLRLA